MPLIYTLVFLGFFAGALVSPVLAPMFLHPTEHGVLTGGTSIAMRTLLLGLALSMMRFGEFIGSPILGLISDRLGRKNVLAFAMAITAAGNVAVGWAIQADTFWVIIAGQFFIGFAGVLLVLPQHKTEASTMRGKTVWNQPASRPARARPRRPGCWPSRSGQSAAFSRGRSTDVPPRIAPVPVAHLQSR